MFFWGGGFGFHWWNTLGLVTLNRECTWSQDQPTVVGCTWHHGNVLLGRVTIYVVCKLIHIFIKQNVSTHKFIFHITLN